MALQINPAHAWFYEARFGLFIHWGPYSVYGRGEQMLNREWADHKEYAQTACAWNPQHYDPHVWARVAVNAGMKYAVLTTRHHDGYCLWDTKTTDYSSFCQAPRRDFVREFVDACRQAGLRIGLYHSLLDFRLPGWLRGPEKDPQGFAEAKQCIYDQIRELLTAYGKIDVMWFDGIWPRTAHEIDTPALVDMIRSLQPAIMINDRLEYPQASWFWQFDNWQSRFKGNFFGDFGTPEQGIYADNNYLWESCQTASERLWGYSRGEAWRSAEELLGTLVKCAVLGGNFLLNVGPQPDGQFPSEFVTRTEAIGEWLRLHGEAIYGCQPGDVTEFVTRGWQTVNGNNLYLIRRNWDGGSQLRLRGLTNRVKRAFLLTTELELEVRQEGLDLVVSGLPTMRPTPLYPVIKLECDGKPQANEWGSTRVWGDESEIFARWAEGRGTSRWVDGKPR